MRFAVRLRFVRLRDQGDPALERDDGTGLRQVVSNSYAEAPAVSPSGVDVASSHECDPGGSTSIWMTPFATSTQSCNGRRITPVDGFQSDHPTWNTRFVVAYHRLDRPNKRAVIVMASAVDSQSCILTSEPEDSRNPSWSP